MKEINLHGDMMNTIQRYELVEHSRGMETYHVMDWMDDGDWVKFEDHEKIVADLQTEIDRLNDLYNNALGDIAQLEEDATKFDGVL